MLHRILLWSTLLPWLAAAIVYAMVCDPVRQAPALTDAERNAFAIETLYGLLYIDVDPGGLELGSFGVEVGAETISYRDLPRLSPRAIEDSMGRIGILSGDYHHMRIDVYARTAGRWEPEISFTKDVWWGHVHAIDLDGDNVLEWVVADEVLRNWPWGAPSRAAYPTVVYAWRGGRYRVANAEFAHVVLGCARSDDEVETRVGELTRYDMDRFTPEQMADPRIRGSSEVHGVLGMDIRHAIPTLLFAGRLAEAKRMVGAFPVEWTHLYNGPTISHWWRAYLRAISSSEHWGGVCDCFHGLREGVDREVMDTSEW